MCESRVRIQSWPLFSISPFAHLYLAFIYKLHLLLSSSCIYKFHLLNCIDQ